MDHSLESFLVKHDFWLSVFFAVRSSKHEQIDTVLVKDEEVVRFEQESFDWRLPELVAFVPVSELSGLEVDDEDVVCVDAD